MSKIANYINHIALVLDASTSMSKLSAEVVKVADQQIEHLAMRSKELDQETRVTVYTFSDPSNIRCLVYDKDVLRMPSIKGLYHVGGWTALVDATMKALEDLSKTAQLYGEHAFLTYVLTDGEENRSRQYAGSDLSAYLNKMPDNWTLAAFVPNALGVAEAKRFGFAPNNIAVWNADSKGVSEVGETIRKTSDTFLRGRAVGVQGYKNSLFSMDTQNLSKAAVSRSLDRLGPGQFHLLKVTEDIPIAKFVEQKFDRKYVLGEAYYQLTKPEKVQPKKAVALYEKASHSVYTGDNARSLLGLPNREVKVKPEDHGKFDIFVQSTSVNRKLIDGTKLLVLQ